MELGVSGSPLLPQVSPGWVLAKKVNAAIDDIAKTMIKLGVRIKFNSIRFH